jgi:predicted dehydrogenase
MDETLSRRRFVQAGAAALGAAVVARAGVAGAEGAKDRIRLGFIGTGNRGGQVLDAFLTHEDCVVTAVCDVYAPHLDRAKARVGGGVAAYKDFREVLASKEVDAVVIATPDHWHAIQTIQACEAGKDVYVEKPVSVTVHEGRRMVEAARKHARVVQVGLHRRSSPLFARLAELVQAGTVGHVSVARAYHISNMAPAGMGRAKPSEPPADLDWDLWLGPRAMRPYQENICPYKFRWWQDYSSQIANNGVHYLDAIRWMTGDLAPASVCAMGGRFIVDDDRTIPDTMEATFQFGSGRLVVFGQYEASGAPAIRTGEVEVRGTLGTVYASGARYEVAPETGGQFQDKAPRMAPITESHSGNNADLTALHARNFLDCVRSRATPNADIEVGHRSTTMSLLANISLATGKRLEWDAENERITNEPAANDLLHYEYRAPWALG